MIDMGQVKAQAEVKRRRTRERPPLSLNPDLGPGFNLVLNLNFYLDTFTNEKTRP